MFKTPHSIAFIGLTIATLTACNQSKDGSLKPAPPPLAVDVIVAQPQPFSYDIDASGTVSAKEFVELRPEVGGRIVKLNINEGSKVAEGDLLVKLNDDELQAQLRKTKSQLEIAERNLGRLKTLKEAEGLNQQEYDIAENQVNNLQADMDYTKAQIRKTEIRAPFSGMIGLRNVSLGAYVNNLTLLATLQQTNELKIDFLLPESQSTLVHKGMRVNVKSNNQTKPIEATVAAIEPQVNTGTRNIKVRALLSQSSSQLIPGSFVHVSIPSAAENKAIIVPTNCVIPETRNKKVAVIKGGKILFTVVTTGYRTADKVEILSGLNPGDTIAVSGILFLKPDAPVKIKSVRK